MLLLAFWAPASISLPRSCLAKDDPGHDNHAEHHHHDSGQDQGQNIDNRWVEEKTGRFLPLDVKFRDENGTVLRLGDFIDRPTILLPIYFYCPNSCSTNLANLAAALNNLKTKAGADYRVIALSFNDQETPETAARAKRNYVKLLEKQFPASEWKFLTGTQESIKTVTDGIGFSFKKQGDGTFVHPSALAIIGENGRIIRYVYGTFLAGDIDIGIRDARAGTPSSSVKRLLKFCFNYDPGENNSVFQLVKIIVLLLFVVAIVFVLFSFKRKKR